MNPGSIKYPRSFHHPGSPGKTSDDKVMHDLSAFEGKEIVITAKLDGECTNIGPNFCHARSLDSGYHPSRTWVQNFASTFQHNIPDKYRICGENLYARHSIHYQNLRSYFYVFNIWDEENTCLDWDTTKEWCQLLGLEMVPEIYRGPWDKSFVEGLVVPEWEGDVCEGWVCRVTHEFKYEDFSKYLCKNVRSGHVQTDTHWMHSAVVPNQLRNP